MKFPNLDFSCFTFGSNKGNKECKESLNPFAKNKDKITSKFNDNSPTTLLANSFIGFESLSTILMNTLNYIGISDITDETLTILKNVVNKYSTDYYISLIKSTPAPNKLKYLHKSNDTDCLISNINALWDITQGTSSGVTLNDKFSIILDTYCGLNDVESLGMLHSAAYYMFDKDSSKVRYNEELFNDSIAQVSKSNNLYDIVYDILKVSNFSELIAKSYKNQLLDEQGEQLEVLLIVSSAITNSLEMLIKVYKVAYDTLTNIDLNSSITSEEIIYLFNIIYEIYLEYVDMYRQQCYTVTITFSPYNPETGYMVDISKAEYVMRQAHDKNSDEMFLRNEYKVYDLFDDSTARKYINKYYRILTENSPLVIPKDVFNRLEDLVTYYTTRFELEDKFFKEFKRQITYAKFIHHIMTTTKSQLNYMDGFDFMNHPATQVILDDLQRQLDRLDQLDEEGKQYFLDSLNKSKMSDK